MPGGVLAGGGTHNTSAEISQVHVAPGTYGSNSIRAGQEGNATGEPCGSKPGVASGGNASGANSLSYGQETNPDPVPYGSKPGIGSGSNLYGQETNPDPVPYGSKPGVGSGSI
jgi:hypothetical protein